MKSKSFRPVVSHGCHLIGHRISTVLLICPRAQSRLPGQLHGCFEAALAKRPATLSRPARGACETRVLPPLPATAFLPRVCHRCQANLRWSGTRSPLSGPLYSPRRHLSPSSRSVQAFIHTRAWYGGEKEATVVKLQWPYTQNKTRPDQASLNLTSFGAICRNATGCLDTEFLWYGPW